MKYLKLNLLIISRFLLIGIIFYGIYYFENKAVTVYELETEKNLQTELFNHNLNELEKVELNIKQREKVNDFSDNLHYLIILLLLGIGVITLISDKIKSENNRLDKIENE